MLYSKFTFCNCGFAKFWAGLVEEFSTLSKRTCEVILPLQNTYLWEAGFSWVVTIKQNIHLDWFLRLTWEHLCQPLFRESQILRGKQEQSLTQWRTGWNCHFSIKQLKLGCVFLLQNVLPFIQWYAGSYETAEFQQPQPTTTYHFLKVFMLTCRKHCIKVSSQRLISFTPKLVPVSPKINVSECKFTTFFQGNLPQTLSRKVMPWHTKHCWG